MAEAASFINRNYIPVRVPDEDRAAATEALRTQHDVEALPTLLVVRDSKGEPRRFEGYPGKRRTLEFLKRALVQKPPAAETGTRATAQ